MKRLYARWLAFWYAPTPGAPLELFRVTLLATLAYYMAARFAYASEWLTTEGFHPSVLADRAHAPAVPLLSHGLLVPFAIVCFASIVFAAYGRLRRPATAVALACVIYVSLADPISAFTLNRLYVFALFLLLVAPAGRSIPAWPIRVLQLTLLLHYAGSGVCKAVYGDWLKYQDVLWMQIQGLYMTDTAAWMVRNLPAWSFTAQQHAALGFELLAPLLLGVRRLRPLGFIIGIGMHLLVAVTMYQLIYFSLQMIVFYAVFLDPAWAERQVDRVTAPAR